MKLRKVADQVVVVMGASSGIGRETALELASRGARVVISARSDDGLDSLADAIRGLRGEVYVVPADVRDPGAMRKVADRTVERYGRIDSWIHLASVSLYARFEDTTPEEFEQLLETNFSGVVNGAQAALPHLRESGGALIVTSSVEAVRALPYQSAYAASKHAIEGLLEALRVELRREKVPVVVTEIVPSTFDTPLFENARTKLGFKPKGFPPMYDPRIAAKAIAYTVEHPTRRLVIGGGGRLLGILNSLAPAAVDGFLAATGFEGQTTRIPKRESARDNFEEPVLHTHRVFGRGRQHGRPFSLYTSWRTSSWARPLTFALAAGAGALAVRSLLTTQEGKGRRPSGTPAEARGRRALPQAEYPRARAVYRAATTGEAEPGS